MSHTVDSDFLIRAKVTGKDRLEYGGTPIQKINRFYVTNEGESIIKHSPPAKGHFVGEWKRASKISDSFFRECQAEGIQRAALDPALELDPTGHPWDERIHTKNESKYTNRETAVCSGRLATMANDSTTIDRSRVDWDYYIKEVEKLVLPLQGLNR